MYNVATYFCQMCRVGETRMTKDDERVPATINCPKCGKPLGWTRVRYTEHPEGNGFRRESGYPYESDQWGCQPSQVKEFTEHARKMGCPTEYTKEGRVIYESPSHHRKFLKCVNRYFNNHTKGKER